MSVSKWNLTRQVASHTSPTWCSIILGLNAVVVELKIVDFMPEFIGKLNFYVSAADELLKGEGDNPSIGILLCKDKDSSVVEWSLRGITTPLGVASYQLQEVYERTLLEIKQEASEEETSESED